MYTDPDPQFLDPAWSLEIGQERVFFRRADLAILPVSQKTGSFILDHNFDKCLPIFKIIERMHNGAISAISVRKSDKNRRRRRIAFKTAVLVYKCLHDMVPQYFQTYCKPTSTVASRRLRSAQVFYRNSVRKMHDICDIRLQKCCDLENRVRGPSRSLEMSPCDRAHTTSY